MIAYKLLNPDLTTYGGMQWVVGETKRTDGTGNLCGPGWLHGYEYAELPHFLNAIHANFKNPVMYKVEAAGQHKRNGCLKSGWTEMTLLEPWPIAIPTTEQRARFAIACSLAVYRAPRFRRWATNWLTGKDRSAKSAWATWAAAWTAEPPDRVAEATAAALAAEAAARATEAAAWAAEAADRAAEAAWEAVEASRSSKTAFAAYAADETAKRILLNAARFAMSEEVMP